MKQQFLPLSKKSSLIGLLALACGAAGCSSPYLVANFDKEYRSRTKSFAVGPVTASPYELEAKEVTVQLRKAIYRELKARQQQYYVKIQSLEESNRRMREAGLTDYTFAQMAPLELCQLLDVDAVLRATLVVYQKKRLFLGGGVIVEVAINHGTLGQMIWHHKMEKRAQIFGNPAGFLDEMGKKVAKNFPFRK